MKAVCLSLCILVAPTAALCQTEDFGMVMDVEGPVLVQRQGKTIPADLGQTVYVGDRFEVPDDARVTVVAFEDCREWLLAGQMEATARWTRMEAFGSTQPERGRRLPVCFSQQDLDIKDSGVVGGLVLRGVSEDPVASLRREFDTGQASSSTLVTLIMYDLVEGQPDRARPYLAELERRTPGSPFVARLSKLFPRGPAGPSR